MNSVIVLLSFSMFVAACAPQQPRVMATQRTPENVIKIATHSPLSGTLAALGEGIKLGAQLAIEKFKDRIERTGFRVELVTFDDEAKPNVGVANARSIIADTDILAVIGHLNSGIAIPSSEVYREVNLVMISPANTNPLVTERGLPNVNRVTGRDDFQAILAAEFAKETLSARSVYILHNMGSSGVRVGDFHRIRAS